MDKRAQDLRDAPGLFVEAFRNFSALMLDEIDLAKAEMKQSLTRARVGIVLIAAALLLALVALHVVADAMVGALIAAGLPAWGAALSVGGGLLIVAALLALWGKSRLSPDALTPNRSLENVQRDFEAVKEASHA